MAFLILKDNENLPFHSSESASTISSRGEYYFPVNEGVPNDYPAPDGIFQITSYDLIRPRWATTPDKQFELLEKYPSTMGEFVWTGFDYLEEPTPYTGDLTGVNLCQ